MNAKKTEELCRHRRPSGSGETFGAGGWRLHRVENSGGTPLTWPAANGRLVSREVLGAKVQDGVSGMLNVEDAGRVTQADV